MEQPKANFIESEAAYSLVSKLTQEVPKQQKKNFPPKIKKVFENLLRNRTFNCNESFKMLDHLNSVFFKMVDHLSSG